MTNEGHENAVGQHLRRLLLDGLAGDASAYRRFLAETSAFLRAYLRRRLGGLPDEVEDLLQECLLALHNQRQTYDPAQPLTAWVRAIARHKLVDRLRRRSHREALHDPLDDDLDVFSTSEVDAVEARRDLSTLLDQLPPRQRLPIVHVKLEGLSVSETAALTGMSESAIKVGVHRGLKALAALLGRQP